MRIQSMAQEAATATDASGCGETHMRDVLVATGFGGMFEGGPTPPPDVGGASHETRSGDALMPAGPMILGERRNISKRRVDTAQVLCGHCQLPKMKAVCMSEGGWVPAFRARVTETMQFESSKAQTRGVFRADSYRL